MVSNTPVILQKGLGGRKLSVPQGRLLGGSGGLNGMNFIVSAKANIDAWAVLGNPGWDWSTFSKSTRQVYSLTAPSKGTEKESPIQVTIPDEDTKWSQVWRETFAGLGFPTENDPFSGEIVGAVDPATKMRSFSANAYLGPARSRANLTVWTQVLVEKVTFDTSNGIVATGVQCRYTRDGESKTVGARQEVVISAGAINSPKILELSGAGDAGLLKSLGIDVLIDNPHVGENLQNHPMCVMCFETVDEKGFETIDKLSRQDPAALGAAMEAYSKQTGPFSRSNCNAMAYVPFPDIATDEGKRDLAQILHEADSAHVDLGKTTPAFAKAHEGFVRSVLASPTAASGYYLTLPVGNYFPVAVIFTHQLSRGSVHIGAASASDPKLAIDPNHLAHPLDVEVLARHARFLASTLAAAEPLASHLKPSGKRSPGAPAGPDEFAAAETGLDAARRYVRDTAVGAMHYTGTCSMMPRELGGVVDPQLRVYGCHNLLVCDANIMPLTTRANSMATVYGIAEKAAEIIKSGL